MSPRLAHHWRRILLIAASMGIALLVWNTSRGSALPKNGDGPRDPSAVSSIVVQPDGLALAPGGVAHFEAVLQDAAGKFIRREVVWTATGGIVDQNGRYVAGAAVGAFEVTASTDAANSTVQLRIAVPPPAVPSPEVRIESASYGLLGARTTPNASCSVAIKVTPGRLGDAPPQLVTGTADEVGYFGVLYPNPRIPNGQGSYHVTCDMPSGKATATRPFRVDLPPVTALSLGVRIASGATENAFLVSTRDAILSRLRATLVAEWRAATRGLGALTIVTPAEPSISRRGVVVQPVGPLEDIRITVVAGTGTSFNQRASDGSREIVVYAATSNSGNQSPENGVATALHELGHIWCCDGPGTSGGHWIVSEVSPGLTGTDRFGLMNDPVVCDVNRTGLVSCPDRFSDRELRQLGLIK